MKFIKKAVPNNRRISNTVLPSLVFCLVCLFSINLHMQHRQCRKRFPPVRTFKSRREIGDILQEEGLKYGVELGVQRGRFAKTILDRWSSAKVYVLVDLWAKQTNYLDLSNKENETHHLYKLETMKRVQHHSARGVKIVVCQDYTTNCAKRFKRNYFDFVYVDARHDYKGAKMDMETWWPLLKYGGIMAGHDYVTNDDGPSKMNQNWTVNYDGTIEQSGRAVKGAVDDFMTPRNQQITVGYRESAWNTWAVRKQYE